MQSHYFTTNDGIRLHYLEAGRGGPVIFLPGCWQSAEEYGFQVDALSQAHRVFALDYRGHGLSEKPDHGYRIARFSKDLSDFIDFLGISKLALVGHSMGNAVAWSYIDLFGVGKIEKLVIVDEPAFLVSNPAWSETELIDSGAQSSASELTALINVIADETIPDVRPEVTAAMVGALATQKTRDWVVACTLRVPRKAAAALLYNHSHQDWRDLIRRIRLPTLVIAGRASNVSWRSQMWIANTIPGAQVRVFEKATGGSHFMFLEAPDEFSRVLMEFLS